MKIESATVSMTASHRGEQSREIFERLRSVPAAALSEDEVQISPAGRSAQESSDADAAAAIEAGIKAAENDPVLNLIRAMLAMLTGREVEVFKLGDQPSEARPEVTAAAPPPPMEVERYERREIYREREETRFAAEGVVRTADGRTLSFTLSLSLSRSYEERIEIGVRQGEARQKRDPLVVNFDGSAAQLTSRRFAFDLDADGSMEQINFVGAGSGFLAIDRSGDGRINDGSELFGTRSGDGFADLAAFDTDANGWIDENDAVYGDLRLWRKDAAGNDTLLTLAEADVGAIHLGRIATPFALKDSANALLGEIRTSGVFLHEDGRAGSLQQIDLTV